MRNCATRKKNTDRWCPPILIRALVLVCFQVPSSTHRNVGCLQDARSASLKEMWSSLWVETHLLGNLNDRTKSCFPGRVGISDRQEGNLQVGHQIVQRGVCLALRLVGLFKLEKKGRSKWSDFIRYLWLTGLTPSQAQLGGGGAVLLPTQHLGLLALSQGQGLECTEHTALKAN